MSTEDSQIHDQESTEFTVQIEQESSREEQVPVEKFIWQMKINNLALLVKMIIKLN